MATTKRDRGGKFETFVLVLILLAVGGAAGAASFTHVHDWTMRNSPASTGDWFGWANAVITELVPIAALLVMRRRRAAGQPIAYPVALLGGALILSVTAQLAVAKPGFFGGLVSVIPALAFAALAKLILGKAPAAEQADTPAPGPSPVPAPVFVPDARPRPAAVPAASVPVVPVPDARPEPVPAVLDAVPTVPAEVIRAVAPMPVSAPPARVITNVSDLEPSAPWPTPVLPADLLDRARDIAGRYAAEHGRQISRDELRPLLGVSNATTGDVMKVLGITRAALNGTRA